MRTVDWQQRDPQGNWPSVRNQIGGYAFVLGGITAIVAPIMGMPIGYTLAGAAVCATGLALMFTRVAAALLVALLVAGCVTASAGKPDWFKQSELTSNQIAQDSTKAVPYPINAARAGGWLERRNQVEKFKRFSDPGHGGYVYVMSFGKFVGYYAIKGKISAVNSQLTNTNQTWDCGTDCTVAVDSIGDDGSFGPNEGGDRGVFFFTTEGVMVETTLDWMYVDKPLTIGNIPQLYQ